MVRNGMTTELVMSTQTLSISLDLPEDCMVESLKTQLLRYAHQLIESKAYRKKNYTHEELCGVLSQNTDHQVLMDDYISEKYNL